LPREPVSVVWGARAPCWGSRKKSRRPIASISASAFTAAPSLVFCTSRSCFVMGGGSSCDCNHTLTSPLSPWSSPKPWVATSWRMSISVRPVRPWSSLSFRAVTFSATVAICPVRAFVLSSRSSSRTEEISCLNSFNPPFSPWGC
jgi:hypothetical protein